MHDDIDEIFGGLEDDDEAGAEASSTEDVADLANALTDLEAAEQENPHLSAQFFGDTPFDYGEPSGTEDVDDGVASLSDLGEAEQENPDIAAQFFGETPFDYGTPSPLAKDAAEEEKAPPADEGVWGDILDEAREGVGSDITMQSPAFRNYLEERAAKSLPAVEWQRRAKAQWRDWQIDFGPVSAPAGETLRVFETPQVPFRGEKLMATDTATPAGTGTMITTIVVGQRLQRPALTFSLTAFFSQQALGNGIKFDTARHATRITIGISFIQACTFMMSLFGKALIAEE